MKKYIKKDIFKLIIIIIVSLLVRMITYKFMSSDYNNFLSKWYNLIIENGKINSLAMQIGNYTPPYMLFLTIGTYITNNSLLWVKIISFIFDIIMSVYICLIVKELGTNKYIKVFMYSLIIPGVIFNSAVIGQCDSIYTAFVLMFVYYIIKDKTKLALFLYGIALSFKLQAIFIAPIMLYLLISKKIKIIDIIYIIIGFFTFMLPAIIYEKSIFDIIMIYFDQTRQYNQIVKSAPNIYSLLNLNYMDINLMIKYILSLVGIISAIFISVYNIKKIKLKYNSNEFLTRVMLLSLIVPYLLPGMMDRYFYMTNIFILIQVFLIDDYFKLDKKIFILASIAYFIPTFGFNYSVGFNGIAQNDIIFQISEYVGVSLISSIINIYIVYKILKKYIFDIYYNIHKNEIKT